MTSRRALIAVLNRHYPRTRAAQKRVEERVAAGLCLCRLEVYRDGQWVETDCERPAGKRRGVCDPCYDVFLDESKRGTPEEAFEYEQEMIRDGMILAEREKSTMGKRNILRKRRRA